MQNFDFKKGGVCDAALEYVMPSISYSCIVGSPANFDYNVRVKNDNFLIFSLGNVVFIIYEGVTWL